MSLYICEEIRKRHKVFWEDNHLKQAKNRDMVLNCLDSGGVKQRQKSAQLSYYLLVWPKH